MSSPRRVMVCQSRACCKQGASKVLAAFQACPVTGVTVIGCGCLGRGNGPMVMICPDEVWYNRLHPDEVPVVVERHLLRGQPVQAMLYRKFHQCP